MSAKLSNKKEYRISCKGSLSQTKKVGVDGFPTEIQARKPHQQSSHEHVHLRPLPSPATSEFLHYMKHHDGINCNTWNSNISQTLGINLTLRKSRNLQISWVMFTPPPSLLRRISLAPACARHAHEPCSLRGVWDAVEDLEENLWMLWMCMLPTSYDASINAS